jgi:hypothetical protein
MVIKSSFDVELLMTTHLRKGGDGVKKLGKCLLTSSLICNLLYHYLPLSLKKAIFMAIVTEVIHERHMIKRRRTHKLPLRILTDIHSKQIANEYSAELPNQYCDKHAQLQVADFFYRYIPSCFRYGSYRSLKHDIINSLNHCLRSTTAQYA